MAGNSADLSSGLKWHFTKRDSRIGPPRWARNTRLSPRPPWSLTTRRLRDRLVSANCHPQRTAPCQDHRRRRRYRVVAAAGDLTAADNQKVTGEKLPTSAARIGQIARKLSERPAPAAANV